MSVLLLCSVVVAGAMAQKELVGRNQFPQFRAMSGLSGSTFPVGKDGLPDYRGAMGLSTPIAYSLSKWSFVAGLGSLSFDTNLRFPSGRDGQRSTNGTAQFMVGVTLGQAGDLTVSYMVLSGIMDNALNLQFTPGRQEGKVRYSVGVQDIGGGGGSAGEKHPADGESSRSFFTVTTFEVDDKTHVSLGTGTRRFKSIFGNVSTSLGPNMKATVEYDAFNWNFGVAYRLGALQRIGRETYDKPARTADAHLFVGLVRGKLLFWGLNISF
jgi:hypothetical protein